MWLIRTTTLKLIEFHGDPREDYAILSHTWGKDEVIFAEFRDHGAAAEYRNQTTAPAETARRGRVLATSGYAKISGAASLSRSHGLQYLWVDTCCINETSSAELSESINSKHTDMNTLMAENSNFRRSRWFTRGWTLQELVAPRIVMFYAKDWSYLLAKEPFLKSEASCTLLAEITGINRHVLRGTTSPGDISVANRMRWVAHRYTTLLEDVAYCLLGLFNDNMPLLYGEGERAFTRLQEEILKETDDQSLFLSPRLFSNVNFNLVRPLPPSQSQESAPVSITNQGLRTSMMLVPCESKDDAYYALLDCIVGRPLESVKDWSPCIVLRRLWGNQFARVASPDEASRLLPHEEPASADGSVRVIPIIGAKSANFFDEDAHGTYRTVYVRQTPFDVLPEVTDRDPRSGATIVALRFGSEGDFERFFLDVTVGLRRIGRRWEVWYEKHSYAGPGSQIQHVYNKFTSISVPLEVKPQGGFQVLEPVAIFDTKTERRGRRFIQIEVFGAYRRSGPVLLYLSPSVATQELPAMKERVQTLSDRIGQASRECCYEESFGEGMFTAASASPTVVRTRYCGDLVELMDKQFDKATIPEHNPCSGLLKAIRAGDFAAVHMVTAANRSLVDATIEELDNCSVIHCAASLGFMGAVRWLIQLGADVRAYTKSGLMPLHLAVVRGRFDIACELAVADPTESVLHLLAAHGRPGWVNDPAAKKLYGLLGLHESDAWAHANSRGELALHRAAANAEAGEVHNWVKPTDVESAEVEPAGVESAEVESTEVESKDVESTEVETTRVETPEVVSTGVETTGVEPIRVESAAGWFLRPPGVFLHKVDAKGRSLLFHAACSGNKETVRMLTRFGYKQDRVDEEGRTPLHAAVITGHAEVVRALLDMGADPNKAAGTYGLTPLHLACLYGQESCVEELLRKMPRETVDEIDVDKRTTGQMHVFFQAIHVAVGNGRVGCVAKLLKFGCEVDGNCDGFLRLETSTGSTEGCLKEGRLVVLERPLVALDIAMILGYAEISSVIEEKGLA
ncbi:het domain protein [Colletotrichum sojae]|uniref:Het domain protein n=1 Tax=Colletotrichum sojae TaxID=2175907 RepID=A0A8H6ITK9_9PEZI|nr:het domain protein [Colletotrichum sojae]